MNIVPACEIVSITGESPVWSIRDDSLYWVDVRSNCIYRMNAFGSTTRWDVGERISSVGFHRGGGLVGTMISGIYAIDTSRSGTKAKKNLIIKPKLPEGTRPKEGKADANGSWWFGGTCDENQPLAGHYRLSPDGQCIQLSDGITAANGIAVNPAGDLVTAADSISNTIWSWDVDVKNNSISERKVFYSGKDLEGQIDGATFDAEGYYWCAIFGGWSIVRISPKGKLDRIIKLPVKYPTMCAFGGTDLRTLFVTTSKFHSMGTQDERPLDGKLLRIDDLNMHGIQEREFG